jgi:hypothetical protein
MRNAIAIAICESVDEISDLAGQAVAAQAYFRQSQDVENEMHANRIRVRAERQLGVILRRMAENGERKIQGNAVKSRDATSLGELGIPKDRASRARCSLPMFPKISSRRRLRNRALPSHDDTGAVVELRQRCFCTVASCVAVTTRYVIAGWERDRPKVARKLLLAVRAQKQTRLAKAAAN